MSLNATPRDPAMQSYVSVAEADAYFANSPIAGSWAGLTTQMKEQCLFLATHIIDGYNFHSYKFDIWQRLKWPRVQQSYQLANTIGTVTDQTHFVVPYLSNKILFSTDFWKYSGIMMYAGVSDPNTWEHRMVVDYVRDTGAITLESAFPIPVSVGDRFLIVQEVARPVKWATMELAYQYSIGRDYFDFDPRVSDYRIGDLIEHFGTGTSGTDLLPPKVARLLRPFIKTTSGRVY